MPRNPNPQTPRPPVTPGSLHVPAKPARKRWEFMRVTSPDDSDLNIFGAEGWELVTIYTYNEPGRAPIEIAVFKREIV